MDKKDLIAKKSFKQFLKYGVHCVTIDDITGLCGVSKKTIYKYFDSKNDLLAYIADIQKNKLKKRLKNYPVKYPNAIISLNTFFKNINTVFSGNSPEILYELKKYYPTIYIEILKFKNAIILPFIKENINQGIKEGLYKNNLNIDELSKSYDAILNMIFMDYMLTNSKIERLQTIIFLNSFFLHRLVSIIGLKELKKL
ncbi:MAG: TetR/AcrR family transcriptional regulator [Flavobacteriaceae bacterium]|jgi:AcrR family transcriptional regulator|nr:TetR/AcrR family transcriptional regulator [Flavobacteriaceae bacterium]